MIVLEGLFRTLDPDEAEHDERRPAPGRKTRTLRLPPGRPRAEASSVAQPKIVLGGGAAEVAPATDAGGALPERLRALMERSFATDFSSVRIHDSASAADAGAAAFTIGDHVHFAPGRWDPDSDAGRELLGHELAHVVQQRAGRVARPQAFTGDGVGVHVEASLEAEADSAASLAVRGLPVHLLGGGGRAGAPIAQPKIMLGKGSAAKPVELRDVEAALARQRGPLDAERQRVLAELDRDNEAFDDLAHLARVIEQRVTGRFTDDDDRQRLTELTASAPARADATSSWRAYWTALATDLSALKKTPTAKDFETLMNGVVATLLYKVHIASFRALDPVVPSADVRQQSRPDLEDPNVYYRSQDKGHPVIGLYKDLIKLAQPSVNLREVLAPYNVDLRAFIDGATPADTAAKKKINVDQSDDLTSRESGKNKKKHTEMSAGYIGLRRNNADAIGLAVSGMFASAKLLGSLIGYVGKQVKAAGPTPKTPPRLALVDEHLDAVMNALIDLNASLGVLSAGSDESPSSSPGRDEGKRDTSPSDGREIVDPSHSARKMGQSATRGDWIVANLGALKCLRVARLGDNPQITAEVLKTDASVSDAQHATFVNAVRVYFGALVARQAASLGAPLAVEQRQSFGFIDTSVTDTGGAFRISIGTEPMEMLEAVRLALIALDGELVTQVAKATTTAARQQLAGVVGGGTKPLATFEKSAAAKYVGYFQAIIGNQDLGAFLANSGNVSTTLKQIEKTRVASLDAMHVKASAVLAKIPRKQMAPPSLPPLYGYELSVVEPLSNAILIVADLMRQLRKEAVASDDLAITRQIALADIAATILRAQAAIDGYAKVVTTKTGADSAQRVATHLALRNATEDLLEAVVVFCATTRATSTYTTPEADMAEMFEAMLGAPVDVARTDSGEQAGAFTIAALRKERQDAGEGFQLDIDTHKTYFELESFLDENGIEYSKPASAAAKKPKKAKTAPPSPPTATLLDAAPFVTAIEAVFSGVTELQQKVAAIAAQLSGGSGGAAPAKKAKAAKVAPKLPYTIVVDVTNIDFYNPEVLNVVASMKDLIAAKVARVVLFNSAVKHEEQSADHYQIGHIMVIGPPVPGLESTTDNPLITHFLGMLDGLRAIDAMPLSAFDPGSLARGFVASEKAYGLLMTTCGDKSWTEALAQCRVALEKGQASSDALAEADAIAGQGYRLIEAAIAKVIAAFKSERVPPEAYEVFKSLPIADQDAIRVALAGGSTSGSGKGKSSSGGRARDAETPVGETTMTGVPNVGNTCYLSAGLSLLAACDAYYALFAPVDAEPALRATLRAHVRGILDRIRAGALVDAGAMRRLLALLDERGLLPPPSVEDRRRGVTAQSAQHDMSEVIFRKLVDYMAPADALKSTHTHVTDFRDRVTAPAAGVPANYSPMPDNRVLEEPQREVALEISIEQCASLAQALAAMTQPHDVEGVKVRVGGLTHAGTARRSERITGAPLALTLVLKRFAGIAKDTHEIDMPTAFVFNGYQYRLDAIVYHLGATASGGHYTASTRAANGAWSYRDDSQVTPESGEHLAANKNRGYVYTYSRGAQAVALAQPVVAAPDQPPAERRDGPPDRGPPSDGRGQPPTGPSSSGNGNGSSRGAPPKADSSLQAMFDSELPVEEAITTTPDAPVSAPPRPTVDTGLAGWRENEFGSARLAELEARRAKAALYELADSDPERAWDEDDGGDPFAEDEIAPTGPGWESDSDPTPAFGPPTAPTNDDDEDL